MRILLVRRSMSNAWERMALDWIADEVGINRHCREAFLDSVMLNVCGNVSGQKILDLGCGDGRFSRILARQGAQVIGVDLCQAFIDYANANKAVPERETYQLCDVHDLSSIPAVSIDQVVSYVTLVEFADLDGVMAEVARVLKPGGRCVICNLHPIILADDHALKDAIQDKTLLDISHYFNERKTIFEIYGAQITSYHRTLSTYIQTFMRHGLSLTDLQEPRATELQIQEYGGIGDADKLPIFIVYVLEKAKC